MSKKKSMTADDRRMIESFSKPSVDKITVMTQLAAVEKEAMKILEENFGAVIPRQSEDELREVFNKAIDNIYS